MVTGRRTLLLIYTPCNTFPASFAVNEIWVEMVNLKPDDDPRVLFNLCATWHGEQTNNDFFLLIMIVQLQLNS